MKERLVLCFSRISDNYKKCSSILKEKKNMLLKKYGHIHHSEQYTYFYVCLTMRVLK